MHFGQAGRPKATGEMKDDRGRDGGMVLPPSIRPEAQHSPSTVMPGRRSRDGRTIRRRGLKRELIRSRRFTCLGSGAAKKPGAGRIDQPGFQNWDHSQFETRAERTSSWELGAPLQRVLVPGPRTSSRTPIEAHKPVHPPVGVEAADRTGDVPLCEPFRWPTRRIVSGPSAQPLARAIGAAMSGL